MCVKLSWLNIEIGLRPIKLILGPDMGRQFSTQSLNLVAALRPKPRPGLESLSLFLSYGTCLTSMCKTHTQTLSHLNFFLHLSLTHKRRGIILSLSFSHSLSIVSFIASQHTNLTQIYLNHSYTLTHKHFLLLDAHVHILSLSLSHEWQSRKFCFYFSRSCLRAFHSFSARSRVIERARKRRPDKLHQ